MRWIYSITLFKTLLALWLMGNLLLLTITLLAGCAGSSPDHSEAKGSQKKKSKVIQLKRPPQEVSPTVMEVTYANKSSKMRVSFDLNSQYVYVDMQGASESGAPTPKTSPEDSQGENPSPGDGPGQQPGQDDWGKSMEPPGLGEKAATGDSIADDKLAKILAEIRKAQELFYQKRYQESLEMTRQSLEKHETAEGLALMGSILYMTDDKEGARSAWKRSLKLNPDMPNVVNMLEKLDSEE